jgi:hypothetical protein
VGLLYKFISFYIHWDDDGGKICRKPGVFLFKLGGFVMFHGNFFDQSNDLMPTMQAPRSAKGEWLTQHP